jgi:hypothetical protein
VTAAVRLTKVCTAPPRLVSVVIPQITPCASDPCVIIDGLARAPGLRDPAAYPVAGVRQSAPLTPPSVMRVTRPERRHAPRCRVVRLGAWIFPQHSVNTNRASPLDLAARPGTPAGSARAPTHAQARIHSEPRSAYSALLPSAGVP